MITIMHYNIYLRPFFVIGSPQGTSLKDITPNTTLSVHSVKSLILLNVLLYNVLDEHTPHSHRLVFNVGQQHHLSIFECHNTHFTCLSKMIGHANQAVYKLVSLIFYFIIAFTIHCTCLSNNFFIKCKIFTAECDTAR